MDAVRALLREISLQAELLERALACDEIAELDCRRNETRKPPREGARPRRWVRQDENRVHYQNDAMNLEHREGLHPAGAPRNQLDAGWDAFQAKYANIRMRTRLAFIIGRLKSPARNISCFSDRALAESQSNSTYPIIAPMIVRAAKAHAAYIDSFPGEVDSAQPVDWGEIERRRTDAIGRLADYCPSDPVPTAPPTQQKPEWDKQSGHLVVSGRVVRKVARRAINCIAILDAFQECDWPLCIDDPLPCGKNAERLNNAVRTLNDSLSGIRFVAAGDGQSIGWRMETSGEPTLRTP
jgi:hypothetical protein